MLGPDGYGLSPSELQTIIDHPDHDAAALIAVDGSIVFGTAGTDDVWPRYLDRVQAIRSRASASDITELAAVYSAMIAAAVPR